MAKKNPNRKYFPSKPIAKLHRDEMVIGGDAKDINPKRVLAKKAPKKKSFLDYLFS